MSNGSREFKEGENKQLMYVTTKDAPNLSMTIESESVVMKNRKRKHMKKSFYKPNMLDLHHMLALILSVLSLGTLPALAAVVDSDNDGVNDYREGKDGTNPNDPQAFNRLSKGLEGYYPLDGNANDESGQSFNGVPVGGLTSSPDRFGVSNSALSFDGINQTIAASSPDNYVIVNGSFTLSAWVKPSGNETLGSESTSGTSYYHSYLIGGTQGGDKSGICIAVGTNGVSVIESGNGFLPVVLSYASAVTNWTHILITCSNDSAPKLYMNGLYVHTGLSTGRAKMASVFAGDSYQGIGGGGYGRYSGFADDIRLYSRALDEDEIAQLYREGGIVDSDGDGVNNYREVQDGTNPNDPDAFNTLSKGLVGYYPFNGNANDESGNGANATVIGAALTNGLCDGPNTAYAFDGASSYMTVAGITAPADGEFTWSTWIQANDDGKEMWLINRVYAVGKNFCTPSLVLNMDAAAGAAANKTVTLYTYADTEGTHVNSPINSFAAARWTHIVVAKRMDGYGLIYIDGVKVAEELCVESQKWDLLVFGADGQIPTFFFDGKMDNIRIYNRVLSESDVGQLYYDEAFTDIQRKFIVANPGIMGLYSQTEYDANRISGQTDVINTPSAFSLFTQAQYDTNRSDGVAEGRDDVINHPGSYGLYTSSSIMDLSMGGLMIRKQGVNATVSFQLQVSTNLVSDAFVDFGDPITNSIPMPGNKGFIRLRASP